MAEIAEAMINGELCEYDGVYIGEPVGHPRYCSYACADARGADHSQVVIDEDEDRQYREERRQKKLGNEAWSIEYLNEQGYMPKILNSVNGHYRIGEWDFWPRTGVYMHLKTREKGRGVKNFVARMKKG